MVKVVMHIICFVIFVYVSAIEDAPEAKIEQGALRGKYRHTWKGRIFSAFTGIPYAKPPVGNLRFQPAVPAELWEGVLDATKPHAICPQIDVFFNDYVVKGDEDCLYLNVYTPQLPAPNKQLLPVMVYIHGGGWTSGNANPDFYGPDILLDKDIVLVTINYRLGALGFLSTEDEVLPGNNGLKDQTLALKWVKKNIANFGGDHIKITIFGQSAGGASTHYHVLSPLSKDLISGAIAHSGSALAIWALAPNDQAIRNTKRLAEFLNCPTSSNKEMIDCLKKVDANDIVEQDKKFMEYSYDPAIPFKPVIEPKIEGAFLTEDPIDIIKSGKAANVPLMMGVTTEDGAFKAAGLYNDSSLIEELNRDFNRLAPLVIQYGETAPHKDYVTEKIRKFYFGDNNIDDSTKSQLTDMFTDAWFFAAQNTAAKLHAKYSKAPVYNFIFGYRGSINLIPLFGDTSYDYGVCHCEDIFYLLSCDLFKFVPNESDRKIIDTMTTIWSNFATTGDPTPKADTLNRRKWKPVKRETLSYYFIKSENEIEMVNNVYSKRAQFWENLPIDSRTNKIKVEL